MKDLKVGDVVVVTAEKTGDIEWDANMSESNGLGKITEIYNTDKGSVYFVKLGEGNTDTKAYAENELEVAITDLTENKKAKLEKALEEIKESERAHKFLGTGMELEESEMEKAALEVEYKEVKEDKEQVDFSKIYVKRTYEIDAETLRKRGTVQIKKNGRFKMALIQDVSKSRIKLVYIKENKEIERLDLTAKEFADIVA